jgi:RHS repeat-associated protein
MQNTGELWRGKDRPPASVSSGTIDYYEEDMLGSSRTLVQAGGTSPCFDADFLPFGYEKDVTTTCSQNYKFEGKERDTETGDDDFGARCYTWRLGRWLSADWSAVPAPVPYANLTNPQTLNLYAMVSDNPESFADLTGHCGTGAPSEPCHDERGHGNSSVEGEPGSSGIVNASCSLESCETLAESSAQGTQIAAQEAAAQSTGEGSPANLERRAAIADAAEAHEGDTSMPYTADHATCNLFCQKAVAESGAPKPEVMKEDGKMGAPSAAELSGDRIPPGWRLLKKGESPQRGDIAARKEHFIDATGHSGIVVSVKNGVVTVMAAHQKVIGKDMSFQPGGNNHFLRYTGE